MEHAFISYSTKNQIAADTVRKALEENGIKTWMAPYDIPAGEKYAGVITQAIRSCACFVLLLSNDAQNSIWVAKEVERAVNYHKTIIPVQLEEVILNDEFELYISSDHAIPCYKMDENSEQMKRLISSVAANMGIAPQKTQEVVKEEPKKPVMRKIQDGENYYYGAFPEDSITGKGEYVWATGDKYVGDFVNGARTGKGEFSCINGTLYVGDFINGKRTGTGEFYLRGHKLRYVGGFLDGKYHGNGIIYDMDKIEYDGNFKNGRYHGQGKTYVNGVLVYDGEFFDGEYSGQGKLYDETIQGKLLYEGNFVDGKYEGQGTLYGIGKSVLYVGNFIKGKFHGKGTLYQNGNEKYCGEFRNDKYHGYGYLREDGRLCYSGDFNKGKFHGQGEYVYPNGNKFVGTFEKGEEVNGILYARTGEILKKIPEEEQTPTPKITPSPKPSPTTQAKDEKKKILDKTGLNYYYGNFSGGIVTGEGEYFTSYGAHYVGGFLNGKYHGKGTFTYNDFTYVGEFEYGKYHGKGEKIDKLLGFRDVGTFVNGKMTGKGEHYLFGQLVYVGDFLDDKYHGNGEQWIGGEHYIGEFKDGKRSGKGECFYINGQHFVGKFLDDKRVKGILYDKNGKKIQKIKNEI